MNPDFIRLKNHAKTDVELEKASMKEFAKWARWYDKKINSFFFNPLYEKYKDIASPYIKKDAVILDLGCGTGNLSIKIAKLLPSAKVVGMDISKEMLKKAKAKMDQINNVDFIEGKATSLPFNDNDFHAVLIVEALHHFPNHEKVFSEINRILKKEGVLYILDGSLDGIFAKVFFGFLVPLFEKVNRFYKIKDLSWLLKQNNFSVVKEAHFNLNNIILAKKN